MLPSKEKRKEAIVLRTSGLQEKCNPWGYGCELGENEQGTPVPRDVASAGHLFRVRFSCAAVRSRYLSISKVNIG